MKYQLRGCILFSLVFSVFLLSACKGKNIEEPSLKIMAGDQEIEAIYYGNENNQTREEIEKGLKKYMEEKSFEDIPYVALNEKITIETKNFKTKEFKVFDYILAKTGAIRYNDKVVQTSVVEVKDGKATITLLPNPASMLSSDISDYGPGKTFRGFVIRADIEDSSFTFAFILRADSNISLTKTY